MSYDRISKITVPCYKLKNFTIKHSVRLSQYNENTKSQQCFHNEVEYFGKFGVKNINITLNFYPNLIIEENNKPWNERETILLNYNNFYRFKKGLNNITLWFTSERYKDLYAYDDGKLIINAEMKELNEMIILSETSVVKAIPIVLQEDNMYEAVKLMFNNDSSYEIMPIGKFMAFVDFINGFNLYRDSLSILSYIGRPEIGKYSYDMNLKNRNQPQVPNGNGRQVNNNINKHFKLKL